ncbi:MAG: protein-L-isoaspartate O-methyltransferase family protein, partial [Acidiferrobacteraceae bacterium]
MNFETARFNMIQQQIRPYDVLDERVLAAIARCPREEFVPVAYRSLAFADLEIPLGRGEVMLPPKLEARLLQELDLAPTDHVLEVGTGSGYFTALLAMLAQRVDSVEIIPEFKGSAEARLA